MKLNKKLLMAALAGAIVVGGGVNTFAADQNIPKTPEAKDQGMFVGKEYKASTEKEVKNELVAAKNAAKAKLERLGIKNPKIYEQIEKAKNSAVLDNFVETVVKSNAASNPGKEEEDNIPEDSPYYRQTPFAYRTKEEAEQSAKKALENELLNPGHINNGYEVVQKADGNWDYVLKIIDKSEDKKPENKKPENKKPENKKPENKKPENKKPENKKPENKKSENKKPNNKKQNTDSPKKKKKFALPKAGNEAEILTLAAASLSSAAGAFISLKKRK
ncbi:MAG: DUF5633 domain-containing protein [Finegoldia sp.]|uniref:DUF5633 domain-containing protein n=1 Tax=Finegoldia sp. TaxID=1981334 RepID=UPI00399500F0